MHVHIEDKAAFNVIRSGGSIKIVTFHDFPKVPLQMTICSTAYLAKVKVSEISSSLW